MLLNTDMMSESQSKVKTLPKCHLLPSGVLRGLRICSPAGEHLKACWNTEDHTPECGT